MEFGIGFFGGGTGTDRRCGAGPYKCIKWSCQTRAIFRDDCAERVVRLPPKKLRTSGKPPFALPCSMKDPRRSGDATQHDRTRLQGVVLQRRPHFPYTKMLSFSKKPTTTVRCKIAGTSVSKRLQLDMVLPRRLI
jgi:hypothetical protein